jgi:hypothetical protein
LKKVLPAVLWAAPGLTEGSELHLSEKKQVKSDLARPFAAVLESFLFLCMFLSRKKDSKKKKILGK